MKNLYRYGGRAGLAFATLGFIIVVSFGGWQLGLAAFAIAFVLIGFEYRGAVKAKRECNEWEN